MMGDGSGDDSAVGGRQRRVSRLSRRAARLVAALPVIGRLAARSAAGSDRAEFERRVVVPVSFNWTERAEWREIGRGFTALASEGLWMSLTDRLRGVDQTRQQFASGRRYFDCALSGALQPVLQHLGRPPEIDRAMTALAPIASLQRSDPRDYVPAVLLCRALTEIGCAVRGPMPPDQVPPEAARAAAPYFERAEAAIARFDPIEENSPMIAEARYRLVPGIEGGADYLRDWYEDWADLDPSNPEMLTLHSRFLMPAWYGDLDEIEIEARRAVKRAEGGLGLGAYAQFWRLPLESDPAALARVDVGLFLAGIDAALTQTGSQALANEYAALLFRLSLPRTTEGRHDALRHAPVREAMAAGFSQVLRRHVQELHPPAWGMDETAVRRVVAGDFEADYAAGAIIRVGETGIVAELPEQD